MILAIDPGVATLGWAVVAPKTGAVIALGEIYQPSDDTLSITNDRARRTMRQADQLHDIVGEHEVNAIAAEAVSLGGPPMSRVIMASCLNACWGMLGCLAVLTSCDLIEVPPKMWQHAIVGEDVAKVNYEHLYMRMRVYVAANERADAKLRSIPQSRRNHVIDALGVGLFAALRDTKATRIEWARATA